MPTEEVKRRILAEIQPHFGSFQDEDALLNHLHSLTEMKPELFRFRTPGPVYAIARDLILPEYQRYRARE